MVSTPVPAPQRVAAAADWPPTPKLEGVARARWPTKPWPLLCLQSLEIAMDGGRGEGQGSSERGQPDAAPSASLQKQQPLQRGRADEL